MKKVLQNFNYDYCCEIVEHKFEDGKLKFKIVSNNGNCYSHLTISILNSNGLHAIANEYDITGYEYVSYAWNEELRLKKSMNNIFEAEEWIKKVFK